MSIRIPSGVTDQYVYFVAVDSTDYATRETGLSSFTVYRSRNGAAAAAMTTPTINETDTTNMPGVYELLLDEDMTIGSGNDSEAMVFHITHAGMAPVTLEIELYRPKITAGNTLTVAADGDLSEVNTLTGHTVQTGDNYARLGAPAGASVSADIADLPTVSEFNARTLAAASYFDPDTDTVANVTTVGSVTGNVGGNVTGSVGSVLGDINTTAGTIKNLDALDTAQDAQHSTTQSAIGALNDIAATDIVSNGAITTLAGAVVNVDTVDTTTTNSDMRGTDNAATATALATHDGKLDTVDGLIDSIIVTLAALNDVSTTDIEGIVIETGYTLKQTLQLVGSAAAGKLSGAATTTNTIRSLDDSADRITATVDTDGNRSAVTHNV